jgi:hypothetical protein
MYRFWGFLLFCAVSIALSFLIEFLPYSPEFVSEPKEGLQNIPFSYCCFVFLQTTLPYLQVYPSSPSFSCSSLLFSEGTAGSPTPLTLDFSLEFEACHLRSFHFYNGNHKRGPPTPSTL